MDPSQRVWIIDPLDGTVNYANGIPVFCVSVGLAIGGRPALGVIYDPVRDEMFTAQAGTGRAARRPADPPAGQGQARRLRRVALTAAARLGEARAQDPQAIRVSRSMGSAALALAYVGNGRFDAFVQTGGLSLWDICAAGLIASEGGAT